jgi:DNA-binding transcriptional MerR regulator
MNDKPKTVLPAIPAKRYFTIGEVSDLCMVKPHVLRYWEQEFTQLRPMKRRGNRRYYQHHEVLLVRRIRDLLYEQGFTISGARNQLGERGPDSEHDYKDPFSDRQFGVIDAHDDEDSGRSEDENPLERPMRRRTDGVKIDELELEQVTVDLPKAREYLAEALKLLD